MAAERQSLAVNLGLSLAVSVSLLGGGELIARAIEHRMSDPFGEKLALWEKVWAGDFYLMHSTSAGWPPSQPINPEGLQDRTHATEKPEGVWRVVILGDSVTAGTPFKPAESFPAMLQAQLEQQGPWVEVLNVALWGWSTRQERTAFERIARRYHPDQVIVGLCLNDVEELQNNLERPPLLLSELHRHSALVRRLVHAETRQIHSIEELFTDTPRVRRGYERLFSELRALRAEVQAQGATLSILVFPVQFQLGEAPPPPLAQRRLAAFCASEGIRCVDLLPALAPLGQEAFLDLLHFRLPGRRVVAERILAERLIPDRVVAAHALALALGDATGPSGAPALGPGQLPGIERALVSRRERLRAEAAWALGRLGPAAASAIPSLLRALHDDHECVRADAASALGETGQAGRVALPDLLAKTADPRASVRWHAIDAAWKLGGHTAALLPALATALASPDAYVRAGAIWILRDLGPEARPALSALTAAARDPEPGVRAVAVQALARIGQGDPTSIAALASALRGKGDADYRWKAARALGHLGPLAQDAVPTLLAEASDENGHVRQESIIAVGRIGGPAAVAGVPVLVRALEDRDPDVRRAAATALGRLQAREALPALRRHLTDPDENVRGAAQRALARLRADAP